MPGTQERVEVAPVSGRDQVGIHRARVLALSAFSALLLGSCALPPPPGALFEWSAVSPISLDADRPLRTVDLHWENLLQGTPPAAGGCGAEVCSTDENVWVVRCIEPRAAAFAHATIGRLRSTGEWHAQSFAWLSGTTASMASDSTLAICSPRRLANLAAAGVVRAMAAQAAAEAERTCRPARRAVVEVAALTIDHERQSFGDFVGHDLPAVFGSTLGAIFTLGTVTSLSTAVHRVVELRFAVESAGGETLEFSARGAAGVSIGSLKMAESGTPPPPELVGVAFAEALRNLDDVSAAPAARDCPAVPR
jgi:hypothetical protein